MIPAQVLFTILAVGEAVALSYGGLEAAERDVKVSFLGTMLFLG